MENANESKTWFITVGRRATEKEIPLEMKVYAPTWQEAFLIAQDKLTVNPPQITQIHSENYQDIVYEKP